MHSHIAAVNNGQAEYVVEVTRDLCREMHTTGTYIWGPNKIIQGLKVNHTINKPITLAGGIGTDGTCHGSEYVDPYGSWSNVIVQGKIEITIQTHGAVSNLEIDRIHLKTGTACQYSAGSCIDSQSGYSYWNTIENYRCRSEEYDVLYEGKAQRLTDETIIYSLTSEDITFALTRRGEERLCGFILITTEHPRLLVVETDKNNPFVARKRITAENLDLLTYINSKFVYVERHVRTQMSALYRDILKQHCLLEQQIMKNALSIATQSPDEFAYHLMKGPGYMALIAGEAVHLLKCIPVIIKIRRTTRCYIQLPVFKGNESYFLTPRTHILMRTGTQVTCNRIAPSMYLLEGNWYRVTPELERALPPDTMKPTTRPTWNYTNPGSLASSGIYSESDLERLRDHVMFPIERPGVLNSVARGATGRETFTGEVNLTNLVDKGTIQNMVRDFWTKLWSTFTIFGTASAGIMGVFLCLKIIKGTIDVVIHGYALHRAYGWSLYLIGAIFDSITNLLLHLARGASKTQSLERNSRTSPHGDVELAASTEVQAKPSTEVQTKPSISSELPPPGRLYPSQEGLHFNPCFCTIHNVNEKETPERTHRGPSYETNPRK